MSKFEILCVTMHQTDFSKIKQMNIHSDVIFANQADRTAYEEMEFEGHTAKMITTQTRGVGVNRNLGLLYASADICLFADDDVEYNADAEAKVLSEFEAHPDADVVVFHFETDSVERKQRLYSKTRKHGRWGRMPWATFRIAVRLNSQRKANIWYTTLFGGGSLFPSGEDSMWLSDAKKAGLKFYVSKETIGRVSFEVSTWYTGADERYFYGKGAFYQAVHPKLKYLWILYFAHRTKKLTQIPFADRIKLMRDGSRGYKLGEGYKTYYSIDEELNVQ